LISKEDLEKAYNEDKLELYDISCKFGVSVTTICKYLKKYCIESRGCYIDFSGREIGQLKVIEPLEITHEGGKHVKWRCLCSCGNEHIAFSHHLSRSVSVRCTECSYKSRRSELELKQYIWNGYKRSAKSRGIDFSVERELAFDLFLKQERRCALSGVSIKFAECAAEHVAGGTTASLDRIDSSLGYVAGNIQWLHKTINLMKNTMTVKEFRKWCRLVSETPA